MNSKTWAEQQREIQREMAVERPLSDRMRELLLKFVSDSKTYNDLSTTEKRSFHALKKRNYVYVGEDGYICFSDENRRQRLQDEIDMEDYQMHEGSQI